MHLNGPSHPATATFLEDHDVIGDRVFTTGEAAKLAYVSQQTIIRCVDEGTISAHRVPGSKFRRIPERSLWRFLIQQGIPTDLIGSGKLFLLVAADCEALPQSAGVDVTHVCSAFELGLKFGEPWHRGVVLDYRTAGLPELGRAKAMLLDGPFAEWRKVHAIVPKQMKIKAADEVGITIHRGNANVSAVVTALIDQLTSR